MREYLIPLAVLYFNYQSKEVRGSQKTTAVSEISTGIGIPLLINACQHIMRLSMDVWSNNRSLYYRKPPLRHYGRPTVKSLHQTPQAEIRRPPRRTAGPPIPHNSLYVKCVDVTWKNYSSQPQLGSCAICVRMLHWYNIIYFLLFLPEPTNEGLSSFQTFSRLSRSCGIV